MKRTPLFALFSFALLLAACGGGGGNPLPGGGGSTPTPVPTQTPTPGPTATPTPIAGATPGVVQGPGTALSGSTTYLGGYTPYGIANALDFPVQHGWDGTGQTIAVVIDSDVDRSVIANYLAAMGVTETGTITTISVDGSTGIPSAGASKGDDQEAYLDVETIAGLAPGANIDIYQINNLNDATIAKAYSKVNSDGIADVVNSSFGGCEFPNAPEDPFLASGAAAGIAYVASGGDNGNVCNTPSTVGPNWPASNPNVIGIGGTETRPPAALTSATVWNDTSCSGSTQCAGGGGVSSLYSLPSYQRGLSGVSSTAYRNSPDFSLPAENTEIDYAGTWIRLNGTSWSAPQSAALLAEVYQYCGQSKGIANPAGIPYYVSDAYPSAYIDVVSGNNQYGSTTPFYTAGHGYDDASGLGVPYGMAFANTACPARTKASGLARVALSTMVQAPRPAGTLTLDVTPRVRGLVDLGARPDAQIANVQLVLQPGANQSAVEGALEAAGFTIDRRYQYARIVDASAPAGAVNRFFRTQLHDVVQPGFGTRYLPATQIVVPAPIANAVAAVSLDNVISRRVGLPAAPADGLPPLHLR